MTGSIAGLQITYVCVCLFSGHVSFFPINPQCDSCLFHPKAKSTSADHRQIKASTPHPHHHTHIHINTKPAETQGKWLIEWNLRLVFWSKSSDNSSACQPSKQTESLNTKLQGKKEEKRRGFFCKKKCHHLLRVGGKKERHLIWNILHCLKELMSTTCFTL